MQHNAIEVGGTLDASAPRGGAGGFIETSAAQVNTRSGLVINAGALPGQQGGTWLIDPFDYLIDATAAGNIVSSLNSGTSVTVTTATSTAGYGATSGTNGDITVSAPINKTAGGDATLTLRADRNITVNQNITSTTGELNITLSAANNAASDLGGIKIANGVSLQSNGGDILLGGAGGNASAAQTVTNGIAYARNYSDDLPAVSIGTLAQIKSAGGNITINGYSTKPLGGSNDTIGVHILASAVIDSGRYANPSDANAASGGDINIAGKYVGGVGGNSNKVFGVSIDQPTGNSNQTTISASTTTGSIYVFGDSTYDTIGSYALNMSNNGNAGNLYFSAYSVANLLFYLNGSLQGVTFTYAPPTSGCRTGYPNCGLLLINSSANNSYLYGTYNAVNMSTKPVYVSATITGTKVYDGTTNATNLAFSNISILDPNSSGYSSSNLTSTAYRINGSSVGNYNSLVLNNQNYQVGTTNYVLGFRFDVSPAYTVTAATASLAGVKTFDNSTGFTSTQITASGVNGETLTLTGGPATANSPNVADNSTNYFTALGGLTLGNGTGGSAGLASNYVLPATSSRSAYNQATINPAGVTMLGTSGQRYYNGTFTFAASDLQLSGVSAGDAGNIILSGSATVASPNVGTYTQWASTTLGLSGTNSTNYTLTGGSISAVINPAPLTITAASDTKVYGAIKAFAGTEFTTNAGGLKNGETIGTVTLSSTGAPATAGVAGSPYTITPSAATAATGSAFNPNNYNITYANGALTITPAALTITGRNVTLTYGQTLPATTTVFDTHGLQNNETVGSVSQTSTATVGSPAGITISNATGGTFTAGNYTITYVPYSSGNAYQAGVYGGALTINPAPLTITANSASKTYGDAKTFAGTEFTSSGLQNSETIGTVTLNSTGAPATAGVAGSPYTITPSAATGGSFSAANYSITYANGNLTVTPAALQITARPVTLTYGQTLPATTSSFDISGLKNSDAVTSVSQTSTATVGSPASISLSNPTGSPFVAGNYTITYVPYSSGNGYQAGVYGGALTINPAPLTITANSASKTYGDAKTFAGTEFTSSGLQNSETIGTVTLSSTGAPATAGVAGSPYTIAASAATGGSFSAANYIISYANGSLTVNRAPLAISVGNITLAYGQSLPATTTNFDAVGLKNGETVGSVSQTSTATVGSPAGIVLSNATGGTFTEGNYTITYVPYSAGNTYQAGVYGGALIISAPAVQYTPIPIVVQPISPPVFAPSGLNYIPIQLPVAGAAASAPGVASGAATPSAPGSTPSAGGLPAPAVGSALGSANTDSGSAGTGSAGGAGLTASAQPNTTAGTDNSEVGGSAQSNENAERVGSAVTAIGQVRDLVGPTNIRVVNGGINIVRP